MHIKYANPKILLKHKTINPSNYNILCQNHNRIHSNSDTKLATIKNTSTQKKKTKYQIHLDALKKNQHPHCRRDAIVIAVIIDHPLFRYRSRHRFHFCYRTIAQKSLFQTANWRTGARNDLKMAARNNGRRDSTRPLLRFWQSVAFLFVYWCILFEVWCWHRREVKGL